MFRFLTKPIRTSSTKNLNALRRQLSDSTSKLRNDVKLLGQCLGEVIKEEDSGMHLLLLLFLHGVHVKLIVLTFCLHFLNSLLLQVFMKQLRS